MESMLTVGAVNSMLEGQEVDKPIFQYLGSKKISGQGGTDRFRMQISDGVHSHTFAMLATQLNHMIPEGTLDNYCIFRADKMIANQISGNQDRKVLIILELTVLKKGNEVNVKLGNPVVWNESNKDLVQKPIVTSTSNSGNGNGMNGSNNSSASNNKGPTTPYGKSTEMSRIAGNFNKSGSPGNKGFGNQDTLNKMQNVQRSAPTNVDCIPIKDITPYNQRVSIKARVVNKTPVKHWSNSRGEGKLFSMDLLDDSGEIRCTLFKEAVDEHFDRVEIGQVYIITKFQVKIANKNFTSIPHDYEISFGNETELWQVQDDSIPAMTFNFVKIADIENAEANAYIDTIGICKSRGEIQTLHRKSDNKEMTKRDILLVDQSGREVSVTLWDAIAKDFEDDSQPVIAIKGAKVSDFSGKSLSVGQSSVFQVNPDMQEAHILRGWFDNEGNKMSTQSLSVNSRAGGGGTTVWKTLKEANSMDAGQEPEKGDYFTSKVTIVAIRRENTCYTACPGPNCNKKVIDNQNGLYRCEKCDKDYDSFKWRFMLSVNFGDNFDNVWATCFNETAEAILNGKSDELGQMQKENSGEFDVVVKNALFNNYIAKFRSKTETYNGESRKKVVVVELQKMKYSEYAKKLLMEIREQM